MFNVKQIRALKARLKDRHVCSRIENGATLNYLEGWHVIAEANRIFGFDGWHRETVESTCVYTKRNGERYEAVYTAKVRIRVEADGHTIIREGTGTGEADTLSPGQAHDHALKAAETDATKRALMTFGNQFGLSLYAGNGTTRRPSPDLEPPALQAKQYDQEPAAPDAVTDKNQKIPKQSQTEKPNKISPQTNLSAKVASTSPP